MARGKKVMDIVYRPYAGEHDLPHIMALVQTELSEPYVVYTYRYFLHNWPHLAFLALTHTTPVGVVVCKQSLHRPSANRGYIAMLSVSRDWRKRGIATALVTSAIRAMKCDGVQEIVLETEFDNVAALSLYQSLGFMREKRLFRFYLNGKDAFRLVLPVPYERAATVIERDNCSASSGLYVADGYRAICVSPSSDDDEKSAR